ncbi:MAG: L-2-amino-thiazoline-4-carboxylic acid hydrolase [Clostridia bacterium]|nr:L-2-amino-thiazoline-4-carboxylic acid hydrolase [Clostridia bacterium]
MGFNEKTHAFIAARYYERLKEAFGEMGKAAFIHAVQYYAGQRGRRMAQRAIRDGKPLNHRTFLQYGELVTTSEVTPADGELISLSPDYEIHITNCPWHDQFRAMGCLEAGSVYCRYLDEALSRGFNPEIVFEAPVSLNNGSYCLHRVRGTYYDEYPSDPPKNEYKRDFSYHCGNLYWAFNKVTAAIFSSCGEEVNQLVMKDFCEAYGEKAAAELAGWERTDFNFC